MTNVKQVRATQVRVRLAKQHIWIETHGGSRMGYITRYGNSDDPPDRRFGEGGQHIWEADQQTLRDLEAELDAIIR